MNNQRAVLVTIYLRLLYILHVITGCFTTLGFFKGTNPRIFLIGTPEHDNLGDHAIALAEIEFIQKYFPEYELKEITVESFSKYRLNLRRYVRKEDLFFLTGGGNMGDVYLPDEKVRHFIISRFPNNAVMVFPQTIFFSNNEFGKKQLELSKKIYNRHKRLILVAREKISYEIMKYNFSNCEIVLCPDMAFSLNVNLNRECDRKYIGICLRNDGESILSEKERDAIISLSKKKSDCPVKIIRTCLDSGMRSEDREKALSELFEEMESCVFIITDRLHGMVFSAITATPCISMQSKSHKISGTKEWLSSMEYIQSSTADENEMAATLENITSANVSAYNSNLFHEYYEKLSETIRNIIGS